MEPVHKLLLTASPWQKDLMRNALNAHQIRIPFVLGVGDNSIR
jgi:hypothetical protein